MTVLELIGTSTPFAVFFLIIVAVAMVVYMKQFSRSLDTVAEAVKKFKENVVWKDTFEQFEKRIDDDIERLEKAQNGGGL